MATEVDNSLAMRSDRDFLLPLEKKSNDSFIGTLYASRQKIFQMVNYLQNTKSLVRYAFINEILVGRFNKFTLVR